MCMPDSAPLPVVCTAVRVGLADVRVDDVKFAMLCNTSNMSR